MIEQSYTQESYLVLTSVKKDWRQECLSKTKTEQINGYNSELHR